MGFWSKPYVWGDDDFIRVFVEPSFPPTEGGVEDDVVFAEGVEIELDVVGLPFDKIDVLHLFGDVGFGEIHVIAGDDVDGVFVEIGHRFS